MCAYQHPGHRQGGWQSAACIPQQLPVCAAFTPCCESQGKLSALIAVTACSHTRAHPVTHTPLCACCLPVHRGWQARPARLLHMHNPRQLHTASCTEGSRLSTAGRSGGTASPQLKMVVALCQTGGRICMCGRMCMCTAARFCCIQ